jgi:hypothetical protein
LFEASGWPILHRDPPHKCFKFSDISAQTGTSVGKHARRTRHYIDWKRNYQLFAAAGPLSGSGGAQTRAGRSLELHLQAVLPGPSAEQQ